MNETYRRILQPPRGSFFLLGPRGTGKSTWLRHTFPKAWTVDLFDEARFQFYLADAGRFARELTDLPRGSLVVVDEIQRLPSLLNEVHRHIETKGLRFILCGSSARKLKQAGTNLLAGRAVRRHMHPFVPEELGDAFSLDEALAWGTLPVIRGAEDRRDALEAYVQMYLKEEVRAEALVRNLPGFARFLPVAALFHGQTLSVSGLARDAGVARNTISGFLDVLEDTLLAFRLPAFEGALRVRERRHPKLYFADPGLPRALKRQFGSPAVEERGPLFEGWVAGLLRAYRDYRGLFDDWYYWAPAGAVETEVDFLLRRGKAWTAVEAKATRAPADRSFKGLRAVAGLPGLARRILVHLGDRPFRTEDGIEGLPAGDFVRLVETDGIFAEARRTHGDGPSEDATHG